ncbi:MAG: thiamine pyrophosphate-dependent dehydrogenase E1 component subunit alpha [Bacteroidetes bacterium]|nr:thiamine pyrophosphate-dependent dehydrogenase E1 component subunit alpha [Bacteroidota bacterium]
MDKERCLDLYRTLFKIRTFEEKVSSLYAGNEIPGFVHLYIGEEAIASGICNALERSDYITSTHRGHGHLIAKGGDLNLMMAELFGKKTGYCKGKGGSMHIADPALGILGANGIVGGGIPIAVGAAYSSAKIRHTKQVVVAFFGDGATNEGTFHESMNMASAWNLPVLFVCENNQFGVSTRINRVTRNVDLSKRALAYGIPGFDEDGNDVLKIYTKAKELISKLRNGEGPFFLVCNTFRHHGHFEGEGVTYWGEEELLSWKEKDPLKICKLYLKNDFNISDEEIAVLEGSVMEELEKAVAFARLSKYPRPEEALEDLYSEVD